MNHGYKKYKTLFWNKARVNDELSLSSAPSQKTLIREEFAGRLEQHFELTTVEVLRHQE
jgi:hypothetical protein